MMGMSASPSSLAARPCGVCGAAERSILFRQSFTVLSSGTLLTGYDVVVCAGCGFAFADRLPPPEAFEAYYAGMSKYEQHVTGGLISPLDARRFGHLADCVSEVLPDRSAPILDIGCATGGLLATLRERGYTSLLGIDPSPRCAALAHECHGMRVITGTVERLDAVPGAFQLVMLAAVLEHLPDPAGALPGIRGLLAEDGLLLVEVPDVSQFTTCLDAPFQQFSMEHINYFSRSSLCNLMVSAGFAPVAAYQYIVPQSELSRGPVLCGVYRKMAGVGTVTFDTETEGALQEYVRASTALEERIGRQIGELADCGRPVIVWGVGTHTQHLLATTRLREVAIRAFVDSNPHYQGEWLDGTSILPPEAVRERSEPILISSAISQEEIARQIRDGLKCVNELIRLYGMGDC